MSRLQGILVLVSCVVLTLPGRAAAQPTNRTEVTAVLFRTDGKTVISAALDGHLRSWDAVTGKELRNVEAHDHIYGAAVSADGKYVATAGGDRLVKLWDASQLKLVRTLVGHKQDVIAVAFSPDGKLLASGGADRSIRLWDVATGKLLHLFHGHELKVTSLAFSPDGKLLASGGTANPVLQGFFLPAAHGDQVHLWDSATGKLVRKLPLRGTVVRFAPDGQTVAGGGMFLFSKQVGRGMSLHGGTRIGIANLTGKELLLIKGQGSALAYSGDGKFLATAWGSRQHLGQVSIENEVRRRGFGLWEVSSRKEVLQLNDMATVIAISPNGKKAALGGQRGAVNFVDLTPRTWATGKKAADLTLEEFDRQWQALAADNAVAAYEAIWGLAVAGDKATVLLGARLEAVKPAGPRVKQLLANLDHRRFPVRESAFRELKKLGARVEPELRQALQGKASPEVRRRVNGLLALCGRHPATPAEMRQSRALVILERIGSRQARMVLTRLAEGASGAWLTTEAQAALRRMDGKH